mmetsp:Transcript_83595/g.245085  ORF Transcript_83595/g.245085 Transcript_83595/m.245085 type:complete len:233 (+) Transcript_83595:113-811(+)
MEVCQLTSNPEGNWLRISRGSSPVHLPSTGQGGISMDHSWPMNLPMQGRPQTAQLVVLLIPNTSVGNSPPCPTAFTCRFMSSLSAAVQGSPRSTSICTGVGLFTGIVQFCLPITGRVQPELVESAALLPFSARCKVHSTCRDLSAPSSVGRLRLPPALLRKLALGEPPHGGQEAELRALLRRVELPAAGLLLDRREGVTQARAVAGAGPRPASGEERQPGGDHGCRRPLGVR